MDEDKKKFDSLSPEKQYSVIQDQLKIMYDAVSDRLKILPQIAALCATFLVIATFNKDLIKPSFSVKLLLTILLLLVPTTLYVYIEDLHDAERKSLDLIKKYLGKNQVEGWLGKKTFVQHFFAFFPHISVYILLIITAWISVLIWTNGSNEQTLKAESYKEALLLPSKSLHDPYLAV